MLNFFPAAVEYLILRFCAQLPAPEQEPFQAISFSENFSYKENSFGALETCIYAYAVFACGHSLGTLLWGFFFPQHSSIFAEKHKIVYFLLNLQSMQGLIRVVSANLLV